jgi:sec-independent protein translocase protein TatA
LRLLLVIIVAPTTAFLQSLIFFSQCVSVAIISISCREAAMFGFGMPELIIILVIVLVVFGAGKLPEIGGALGKSIRNFKKASDGKDEIEITPKKGEDGDKKA